MLMDVDLKNIVELYTLAYRRFGYSPQSVLWPTRDLQEKRFRELLAMGVPRDDSVLDIGCGLADLKPFLEKLGWRGRYCGIDITNDFLDTIRLNHPMWDVRFHDITRGPTYKQFDWTFISGLFNTKFDKPFDVMRCVLKHAYASTRFRMLFNFISTEIGECRLQMSYYDIDAVFKFCSEELNPLRLQISKANDGNVSFTVIRK